MMNKKWKRIIAGLIALILVLGMVLPMALTYAVGV